MLAKLSTLTELLLLKISLILVIFSIVVVELPIMAVRSCPFFLISVAFIIPLTSNPKPAAGSFPIPSLPSFVNVIRSVKTGDIPSPSWVAKARFPGPALYLILYPKLELC